MHGEEPRKVQYWQLIGIPRPISSYCFYKDFCPSPNLLQLPILHLYGEESLIPRPSQPHVFAACSTNAGDSLSKLPRYFRWMPVWHPSDIQLTFKYITARQIWEWKSLIPNKVHFLKLSTPCY